jgi:hypothetical protein
MRFLSLPDFIRANASRRGAEENPLIQKGRYPMIQILGGVAAGAVAVMVVPSLMPALAAAMRPVVKAVIKGGMLAVEGARQAARQSGSSASGLAHSVEGLIDEVQQEIADSRKVPAARARKKAA